MNILYLHGYNSGPNQEKALFFKERCKNFLAPDMGATFEDNSFTEKLDIAEKALTEDPTIIIGSSLGGYMATLIAARNPQVVGLVLMAPAFGCFSRYPDQQKDYPKYPEVNCPALIFAAEKDELIPLEEIQGFNPCITVVPDADHRFSGLLPKLWEEIHEFIEDITNP